MLRRTFVVASSPDNAGTDQYRQMMRVRLARWEGVTTVNQYINAPQERNTSSNLTDPGWVAARTRRRGGGELLRPCYVVGREAALKACGVGTAKLLGHSWAPNLSSGLRMNVGNISAVPPHCHSTVVKGTTRRQSMLSRWGGGAVVVRGRESRPHGEGPQRVRNVVVDDGGRW